MQHPDKRRRFEFSGTFLGSEFDVIAGWVSAPRHRIGVLMLLTTVICMKGCCSASLLSALLGLWVHVLMFRRPILAMLSQAFADARREPIGCVTSLSRATLRELQALV